MCGCRSQDLIFDRLKKHLDPETGILYIIGLEPIPYDAPYPCVDVVGAKGCVCARSF